MSKLPPSPAIVATLSERYDYRKAMVFGPTMVRDIREVQP